MQQISLTLSVIMTERMKQIPLISKNYGNKATYFAPSVVMTEAMQKISLAL